jgi:hypothetical protein
VERMPPGWFLKRSERPTTASCGTSSNLKFKSMRAGTDTDPALDQQGQLLPEPMALLYDSPLLLFRKFSAETPSLENVPCLV